MSPITDQFNAICQANLVAARQFVNISLDGAENLFNLALSASRKLVDEESTKIGSAWPNVNLPSVLNEYSSSYQDNLQKVLELSRSYLENATKAQTELTRLIQDQMATANSSFVESMQEFSNAGTTARKQTEETIERQKVRKVNV